MYRYRGSWNHATCVDKVKHTDYRIPVDSWESIFPDPGPSGFIGKLERGSQELKDSHGCFNFLDIALVVLNSWNMVVTALLQPMLYFMKQKQLQLSRATTEYFRCRYHLYNQLWIVHVPGCECLPCLPFCNGDWSVQDPFKHWWKIMSNPQKTPCLHGREPCRSFCLIN